MDTDEKAARRAELAKIAKSIRNMSESEQAALIAQHGAVLTCELHALSPFNSIMLILQSGSKPLSQVGGFRQWLKIGRCVRKGEKARGTIYVPMCGKKDGELVDFASGEKKRFACVPMFDVSQTDEKEKVS